MKVGYITKEKEKVGKYLRFGKEHEEDLYMGSVIVVVAGVLRSITKKLDEWLAKSNIALTTVLLQKTTLLGTASILIKVLKY